MAKKGAKKGATKAAKQGTRKPDAPTAHADGRTRCVWTGTDPLLLRYHDEEWGVPIHDDALLFEHLVLAGAQAGLSWITILRKREAYRRAFGGFDPRKVARITAAGERRLLADPGIIRNRQKVRSALLNAKAAVAVQKEFGSLDAFLWQLAGGQPVTNRWKARHHLPATTPVSDAMSAALKERGFQFVGSTICYAFMQTVGMVNDHMVTCWRHGACGHRQPEQP